VHDQDDAALLADAQAPQRRCKPERALLQVAVGERALTVRERNLAAEPARDVGINEIGRRVVGPALQEIVEHRGHARNRNT